MKNSNSKVSQQLNYVILTALFAAIITVTTAYILHIPMPTTGGYIHVGDCFIYLAACFLPVPYAMFAGALGAGLADLLTAPMWILPTVIIKAVLVLPFTRKNKKIINKRNVIGIFIGAIITCLGYYIAEVIMFENKIAPLVSMFPSVIQAAGSGILFIVIGLSLDKINIKDKVKKV